MVSTDQFKKLALSFHGTLEQQHFDRRAFKVADRRIFASVHQESCQANIKLPVSEQGVFCSFDEQAVYAVPNKFGLQGWTTFELQRVPRELVFNALETAYRDVVESKPGRKGKRI